MRELAGIGDVKSIGKTLAKPVPPGRFTTVCRIDTPVEIDYYRHGGILHKVLRDLAGG